MKYFLNYENLRPLIPENKQLQFFEEVFTHISRNLELESAEEISKFSVFKLREKTWKEKNFSEFLTNP
jgi:nucleoid DNA-binding protein